MNSEASQPAKPDVRFSVRRVSRVPPKSPHVRGEWVAAFITTPLEDVLRGVQLPQIETLIIPPGIHPLLRHCHNVENIACVVAV